MSSKSGADVVRLRKDDKVRLDGEIATVVAIESESDAGVECIVKTSTGYRDALFAWPQLAAAKVPIHDGRASSPRLLTALWSKWMQHAIPRIRSAVLATMRRVRGKGTGDSPRTGHRVGSRRWSTTLTCSAIVEKYGCRRYE